MSEVEIDSKPVVRREARTGWIAIDWAELWQYRELLIFYAVRDIKVRYKQTFLGVLWAVLQPLITMVVFTLIFGRVAGLPSDGLPYPVFTLCALLPWQLFVYAFTQSSNSLVQDAEVLRKVYFPRLILPLASVIAGLVDFAIALAIVVCVLFYYGIAPGIEILALPFFLLLLVMAALPAGIFLSALNVKYRDVRYAIPFMAQVWLFASPVAYPSSIVEDKWQALYGLNPMVGVIDGFRWALAGANPPNPVSLAASLVATFVFMIIAIVFFRRMERNFADVV